VALVTLLFLYAFFFCAFLFLAVFFAISSASALSFSSVLMIVSCFSHEKMIFKTSLWGLANKAGDCLDQKLFKWLIYP